MAASFFYMNRRRGVSELLTALIMLSITLAGFGLYHIYAAGAFRTNRSLLTEQLTLGGERAGQQLTLVYSSPITASPISLFVYNYGSSRYILTEIQVKTSTGSAVIAGSDLSFFNPATSNPLGTAALEPGKLTRIDFNLPAGASSPVTVGIYSQICLGPSCYVGRTYTWQIG